MAQPPALSPQGYELQFATNHLGHACILSHFLPLLLSTAKLPSADVRVVTLTSLGYAFHPKSGVDFGALDSRSTFSGPLCDAGGGWLRYGQSKLANILYASALARRHPEILSVSVHPGVVKTPLVDTQGVANRVLIYVSQWVRGNRVLSVEEGS